MNLSPVAACLCYYVLSLMVSFAFAAPSSFVVPWGTAKFGPDGPWQAVKVTLGGNDSTIGIKAQNVTEVSVYPGGVWSTKSFTKAACKEYPNSLCGAGGTWDPDPDQLALQRIGFTEDWIIDEAGLNVSDIRYIALGLTIQGSTTKTVWNASLSTCDIGHITYPNGIQGGVPLGSLSLGASEEYQTFSLNDRPSDNINAALFPAQLHKEGDTPSYSYGLHIGSASFDYPGSLAFGGYNKGRVIGPVTSFRNETAVDLLDIGIGVEYGASPFAFDAKEELLSTGTTKALPNPLAPYLSLPGTTCENIAKLLPVTYDVSLRYYLWNTHDPLYTKIVSSPAYLSFSFPPSPGHTDNVVIKVPFALLNLTLEHPITDSPKQYFPCVPYERGIVLGRAFLQAAFLGRNWIEGTSWLAQAPGPGPAREGLGEQYTNIEENDAIIEGFEGEGLFNQSWAGHWSIVASQKNNETKPDDTKPEGSKPPVAPAPAPAPKGLSTGAKAGIGVGVAAGAVVLFGLLGWVWRRGSAPYKATQPQFETYDDKALNHGYRKGESWHGNSTAYELPEHVSVEPVEVPDTSTSDVRGWTR